MCVICSKLNVLNPKNLTTMKKNALTTVALLFLFSSMCIVAQENTSIEKNKDFNLKQTNF